MNNVILNQEIERKIKVLTKQDIPQYEKMMNKFEGVNIVEWALYSVMLSRATSNLEKLHEMSYILSTLETVSLTKDEIERIRSNYE